MLANLPLINYSLDDVARLVKDKRVISNIFRRISLNLGYSESRLNLIEHYHIKDGDTPESIAFDKYETGAFWWVVLVVNPQFFSSSEWPKTHSQIQHYLDVNYGNRQYEQVPQQNDFDLPFRTPDGIVDHHTLLKDDTSSVPETYAERMIKANELSRKIRLITPSLLFEFIREWERASHTSFSSDYAT